MAELPPEVEQQLTNMSDGDFAALTARVRAPDSTEQLRTAASQVLSGSALDSFVHFADVSKFVGENGGIDEEKVMGHLTAAFGVSGDQQQQRNWGQRSGGTGPALRPGDGGRAAAAKRFGRPVDPEIGAATSGVQRGAAGRAAAERRFGKPHKKEN